jgi:hypothetical protein
MRKKDYADALMVQSACNLSGVVHSFSEILSSLVKESQEQGKGTDWVNTHPICVLFAEQITHLAKGDYFDAYKVCEERRSS